MEENKICPYPGLRPFNDDESIFFRGRDRNIDTIIELFEKKKFMMLTGASGDGKSSLVYAGVVPRARAGLFKAKYNNWAVADFRPERSPLDNLTRALNKHLKFESEAQLKEEMAKGFTSLIRAYKNSPLYIENKDFSELDEKQQKLAKRKAANLLIIADQFEEFFTNTENFSNGTASVESQTVINILLETAKAALAEDIPVYVVCTMRSDYIGQCAAFRGLPEYIGFSQFFVPRLKRIEIQQVIEEPALLNGDKVSERLVQRLLFDISDGLDQLPILQHALNQIWKIAGMGKETLDLIHYAKAGGLSADELPVEQRAEFMQWLSAQPAFKRQLFERPSLENILNAHANELMEEAYEDCIRRHPELKEVLSPELTKMVIKTTFQCLTKIDASRAVRNRMTIQEISNIINHPSVDDKVVGKILDIFRAQGNTFIKPFITEDPRSVKTNKHTILDITHESLIRNWDLLKTWAFEEYENLLNFQDFNKQLQRWLKGGKTAGYLLPIGPLTFFENWYQTCKPNKYWLARYDERDLSVEKKVAEAQELIEYANAFVRKSASRLFVTRTVMKYGANRIMTVFGLLILVMTCTYFYLDFLNKQDAHIIEKIERDGSDLLLSNKVKIAQKADFVISVERLHPGSYQSLLNGLKNDTIAFDICYQILNKLLSYDSEKIKNNPFTKSAPAYLAEALERIYSDRKLVRNDKFFKRFLDFVRLGQFLFAKEAGSSIVTCVEKNQNRLYTDYLIPRCRIERRVKTEDMIIFNSILESIINSGKNRTIRAAELLKMISPFEGDSSKLVFDQLFPKDKSIKIGGYSFTHQSGYQELAYLCAISHEPEMLIRCLDSITKYNPDYYRIYNANFNTVACYMFEQELFTEPEISEVVEKFLIFAKLEKITWLRQFISLNDPAYHFHMFRQPNSGQRYLNPFLISRLERVNALFDYMEHTISNQNLGKDEYHYRMAMFFKQKGMFRVTPDKERYLHFDRALNYLSKIKPEFLSAEYRIGRGDASDSKFIPRRIIFFYPSFIDERYGWQPFDIWQYPSYMEAFIKWQIERGLFFSPYFEASVFKHWSIFLVQYLEKKAFNIHEKLQEVNYSYFDMSEKLLASDRMAAQHVDSNFIFLVQSHRYFVSGDTLKAFRYLSRIDTNRVYNPEFQNMGEGIGDANHYLIETMAMHLANVGRMAHATRMIQAIKDPTQKRNALLIVIHKLAYSSYQERCFPFLDSLLQQIDKSPKFGLLLFDAMAKIGGDDMLKMATSLIKEVKDENKPRATSHFVKGFASNGNYYKALGYIPNYFSSSNELALKTEILKAEVFKRENKNAAKSFYEYDYTVDWFFYRGMDLESNLSTVVINE